MFTSYPVNFYFLSYSLQTGFQPTTSTAIAGIHVLPPSFAQSQQLDMAIRGSAQAIFVDVRRPALLGEFWSTPIEGFQPRVFLMR